MCRVIFQKGSSFNCAEGLGGGGGVKLSCFPRADRSSLYICEPPSRNPGRGESPVARPYVAIGVTSLVNYLVALSSPETRYNDDSD